MNFEPTKLQKRFHATNATTQRKTAESCLRRILKFEQANITLLQRQPELHGFIEPRKLGLGQLSYRFTDLIGLYGGQLVHHYLGIGMQSVCLRG